MTSTPSERARWFQAGVAEGYDFMIVVHDSFDGSDYPVYSSAEDLEREKKKYDDVHMQHIEEVFNLKAPAARIFSHQMIRDDIRPPVLPISETAIVPVEY